jgi:DNA-binding MarR family transcriptional regulator
MSPDADPSVPFQRRDSLGYMVNHVGRLLGDGLRTRITAHGVVIGQFAQLLALFEEDGLTQNQLCKRVRIDQSTMARTLQRMERDGLIRRVPDPADRRQARIMLTERARAIEDDLKRSAQEVNALALRGFTPEEVAACHGLLARLIDNLETASAEEGDGLDAGRSEDDGGR